MNDPNQPYATISPCGKYRYTLFRRLGGGKLICWVMLNPSTADATQDDPTIRRVKSFSAANGYGRIIVVNLFAFRATDPKAMLSSDDPVGPDNDSVITQASNSADATIIAWGCKDDKLIHARAKHVMTLLSRPVYKLSGKTSGPRHPLYAPTSTTFEAYNE